MEVKRNYKKEWEKEKETKTSRLVKIDKELWEELDKKLKEDSRTFTGLVIDAIFKYLNNNKEIKISEELIRDKIKELDRKEKEELKGTKGQDRYSIKMEYMYRKNTLNELLEINKK